MTTATPARPRNLVRRLGVLMLAIGLIIGGYLAYQVFLEPQIVSSQQQKAAQELEKKWGIGSGSITGISTVGNDSGLSNVTVEQEPKQNAATIAIIRIPRFGKNWVRIIRQGVGDDVLNSFDAGVGHYPGTAMPGGIGNFAIAAHDTGYGNAFLDVPNLRAGDLIYISTKQGTYTYRFQHLQTVNQYAMQVIWPVPGKKNAVPTKRLITLTTCWPPYNAQVRLAATGELISFYTAR